MKRSQTPEVLDIGGARIGFDVLAPHLRRVRAAFGHTRIADTDEPPTMWYRMVPDAGRKPRFERDDPLRASDAPPDLFSVERLIDDLHLSIALHATDGVFVHAGVVAWRDAAIVIPGRSESGKSTLVHALVRAGATYLSDEYAVVLADGTIAPYARPIHLRRAAGRSTIDAATIGSVANRALAPGLILFTRFVPRSTFEPERVSPSAAALELFDNTVVAEVRPAAATHAVAQIARTAVAVRSARPDAKKVTADILDLADTERLRS
jgi:hypothetical protein